MRCWVAVFLLCLEASFALFISSKRLEAIKRKGNERAHGLALRNKMKKSPKNFVPSINCANSEITSCFTLITGEKNKRKLIHCRCHRCDQQQLISWLKSFSISCFVSFSLFCFGRISRAHSIWSGKFRVRDFNGFPLMRCARHRS